MRKACEYDFPCEGTCDFCYDPCRCNASLDAAWAEAAIEAKRCAPTAEASGDHLLSLDGGFMEEGRIVHRARAFLLDRTPSAFGPTPAAALRDLAVKLREVKS